MLAVALSLGLVFPLCNLAEGRASWLEGWISANGISAKVVSSAIVRDDAIVAFRYRVWDILLVPCPFEVGKAEVGRVFM